MADRFIRKAPLLIPIFAHRCLPAQPHLAGNPVFSFWQPNDTIYYGSNLPNYLRYEFLRQRDRGQPSDYRYIPFWSDIVS